jgi:hypothetical protein
MADNLTVFQRIEKILNPFSQSKHIAQEADAEQRKEILNAASPQEAQVQNLERQQGSFFHRNSWMQMFSNHKEKRILYESSRLAQYYDYEAMDYYPVIGAALNLMAEECTTRGENGKMLNIYSSDNRVKAELENLFYKVLDIDTTLPFWTRNLIKYGDNFVLLDLNERYGVSGAIQLPNLNMERIEEEKNGEIKIKYVNKEKRSIEFTNYQIAHFRLLGDDRRLPYGMSVLDKVRRVFKMLTMAEDGWLVYVISRVAERRVYKVNVGNAPVEDIPNILNIVAQQVKKAPLTDANGDINFKYSVITNDADYFIPVRSDNASNPIETLPGAQNTDKIEYILYLKDLLYTGLETPKSFLDFSSDGTAEGGGKNMSMLDIRFAKKINKIQQALISELNKIAIIHLHLLGGDFAKNLDNFTLTLTNPSTQAEMLKIELMNSKLDLYTKLVTPSDTGIKPYSEVRAKKEILGMSIDDIKEDLLDQFDEMKIGDEIRGAGQLIKTSGFYDEFIKYRNSLALPGQQTGNGDAGEGVDETTTDFGGTDLGGEEQAVPTGANDKPQGETLKEGFDRHNKRITELLNELNEEYQTKKEEVIGKEIKKNLKSSDKFKLLDLGYTKEQIERMKIQDLRKILKENK